jgi:two-component system CheB/CheR fusion protein
MANDILEPAMNGRRILVVDDNRDAAEALGELLTMEDDVVRICHDGISAIEQVTSWHPEVVLLDIGLPGLDGYEVARRVRALEGGDTVTLVALTGWGQPNDRIRSADAGFDHHLVKPVAFATLTEILRPVA